MLIVDEGLRQRPGLTDWSRWSAGLHQRLRAKRSGVAYAKHGKYRLCHLITFPNNYPLECIYLANLALGMNLELTPGCIYLRERPMSFQEEFKWSSNRYYSSQMLPMGTSEGGRIRNESKPIPRSLSAHKKKYSIAIFKGLRY